MLTLHTVGSGSTGNCHILQLGDEYLLLDAGMHIADIKRALNFNVSGIAGCVVTHCHSDHSKAVSKLRMMGVKVYRPYEHFGGRTPIGSFSVNPIPMSNEGRWLHTNGDGSECPIYAFLIAVDGKKILYMTDVEYTPYSFKKQNLQTMIIGCNYEDDIEIDNDVKNYHVRLGHASLSTVAEIVRVNRTPALRHVILCHLSASADAERMRREVMNVTGAGVTVDIAQAGNTYNLGDTPF